MFGRVGAARAEEEEAIRGTTASTNTHTSAAAQRVRSQTFTIHPRGAGRAPGGT